jgi:hypothetical protein
MLFGQDLGKARISQSRSGALLTNHRNQNHPAAD